MNQRRRLLIFPKAVLGHDCLPGQRFGIYVNADRDWPVGTQWVCPMCDTGWVRGPQQWETVPAFEVQMVAP